MQPEKNISRLYMALGMIFVTCLLISNFVAGKLITLGPLTMDAATITLFPFTYILGDIFTEVYGFKNARFVIWLGFGCNLLAVLTCYAALALPAPSFWDGQAAFERVLSLTPRLLTASLTGYVFGELSNAIILSKLKVQMNGRRLWIRTIASTIVGEACDTVLFVIIAFAGTVPSKVLGNLILAQYVWKVGYEILLTPGTYLAVNWLKHREGYDHFDR